MSILFIQMNYYLKLLGLMLKKFTSSFLKMMFLVIITVFIVEAYFFILTIANRDLYKSLPFYKSINLDYITEGNNKIKNTNIIFIHSPFTETSGFKEKETNIKKYDPNTPSFI